MLTTLIFFSHAAVYCGDQSRSYHGTTIQIVQPLPSHQLPASTHALTSRTQSSSTVNESSEVLQTPVINTPSSTVGLHHSTQPIALARPSIITHKRRSTSSLAKSPHKHGKIGPKRRRTMQLSPAKVPSVRLHSRPSTPASQQSNIQLAKFLELESEMATKRKLSMEVFTYFLQKFTLPECDTGEVLKPLREFLPPTAAQLAEHDPSRIYYLELLDKNADSEETLSQVAEMLLEKVSSVSQDFIVLVGDGKTYEHLVKIKRIYGIALDRLLIFPGDWHVLKNFQPVLMKAYYHVGLKDIASASGYKAETLNSLGKCSHFKRTHSFLLQVWEALYIKMICAFIKVHPQFTTLQTSIQDVFSHSLCSENTSVDLLFAMQELIIDASALDEFHSFIATQAKSDDTWQLWSNFVFHDCFCYVGLFLAIRTSNWDLRMSSLKCMVPLFSAYDRPCYQRLIPCHIADIQNYPNEIMQCFRAGGFTVKVKGGIGHAVALDEAHEMCINRDIKMAVVRPTQPYLKKESFLLFLSHQSTKTTSTTAIPTNF